MSDNVRLEERKSALEKEFDSLNTELTKLNEEAKKLNQRMSEIRARQVQLQGAFQEITNLMGYAETPTLEKKATKKK